MILEATRTLRQRTFFVVLTILDEKGHPTHYLLEPLTTNNTPEVALAWRLTKRTHPTEPPAAHEDNYTVTMAPEGHMDCTCWGHLRWGTCKHTLAIQSMAQRLFGRTFPAIAPTTTPKETPSWTS